MELQVKLEKAEELTYLEASKQHKEGTGNIFRGFEVRKNVRLMFSWPKHSIKSKSYVLSASDLRNHVYVLHLECKLWHNSYSRCIFKLKSMERIEKISLETSEQQTKLRWDFQMLMSLQKGKNCAFIPCTAFVLSAFVPWSYVPCMYLAFRNLKIRSKQGQEWSRT